MALVTLWFVNTAHPHTVLEAEPDADRGFARKYLAQLNPSWPITHIGDFDMNRSASPGEAEFYIGGYPGLSVVQTIVPDLVRLSELPERYRTLVAASDVYATAIADPEKIRDNEGTAAGSLEPMQQDSSTFGGFAHWAGGKLKRSFCATRETVFEETGLPYSFESQLWEQSDQVTSIQLPFNPADAARIAQESWIGIEFTDKGPRVPVAAFAVDGRPETKSSEYDGLSHASPTGAPTRGSQRNAESPDADAGYDDYASGAPGEEPSSSEVMRSLAASVASATGQGLKTGLRGLQRMSKAIGDEVRHRARGN